MAPCGRMCLWGGRQFLCMHTALGWVLDRILYLSPSSVRHHIIMRSRIVGVCLSGCYYAHGVRTCSAFTFPWAPKCGVIRHPPAGTSTSTTARVYRHAARAIGRGGADGGGYGRGCSLPSSTAAGEVEVEMGQVLFWLCCCKCVNTNTAVEV